LKKLGLGAALVAAVLVGWASEARADIIISTDQGTVSPDEKVIFNCGPGCVSGPALTVVGETDTTGLLIGFTGTENLSTPTTGLDRVVGADDDFSELTIDAIASNVFFSEFEANINILAKLDGSATITACNQLGDICDELVIALHGGENFFVLSVISPQLIDTIKIKSDDVSFVALQQIQVTGGVCDSRTQVCQDVTVPEPASMALFGIALIAGGWRFRRKFSKA
jgi:hypothetical protein